MAARKPAAAKTVEAQYIVTAKGTFKGKHGFKANGKWYDAGEVLPVDEFDSARIKTLLTVGYIRLQQLEG